MEQTLKELHSLDLTWDEILPDNLIQWLDLFSGAHNVVKEIMFPAILTAVSGLMAPKHRTELPIQIGHILKDMVYVRAVSELEFAFFSLSARKYYKLWFGEKNV